MMATKLLRWSLLLICSVSTASASVPAGTSDADGQAILRRWTIATDRLERMSVRYVVHQYNTVFETHQAARHIYCQDGQGQWALRVEPYEQPVSVWEPGNIRRFKFKLAKPYLAIATTETLYLSMDENLRAFESFDWAPVSALQVENESRWFVRLMSQGWWNRFIELHHPPLLFPTAGNFVAYGVDEVKQSERGIRIKLTTKKGASGPSTFEQVDSIFRPGADFPYAIRTFEAGLEVRFYFDEPLEGDRAEIGDDTFQLPVGSKILYDSTAHRSSPSNYNGQIR